MAYPNIQNINLPNCCQDRIDRINQIIKIGNYLQPLLCIGVLFNIFGPSPSKLNTIVAVQQTDFVTFSQAVKAVPKIPRKRAHDECQLEYANHIGNGKLSDFWEAMADAFI